MVLHSGIGFNSLAREVLVSTVARPDGTFPGVPTLAESARVKGWWPSHEPTLLFIVLFWPIRSITTGVVRRVGDTSGASQAVRVDQTTRHFP
jgi:hypothetical protein